MPSTKTATTLLVAAVCATMQSATAAIPTVAQVTAAELVISTAISGDNDLIPKLVRLSFHDCVGGCDGCLSFANAENNGLAPIVTLLDTMYDAADFGMSRADLWALAGTKAVMMGATNAANTPTIPMRYGRVDCYGGASEYAADGDPNDGKFPDAHGDLESVLAVFETGMGMTKSEVVAVIGGGHSLGGAKPENSGFRGPWSSPPNDFDNGFFKNLVDLEYTQVTLVSNGVTKYQWEGPSDPNAPTGGGQPPAPKLFMLNSDVVLFREVELSDAGLDSACPNGLSICAESNSTAESVYLYAEQPSEFADEFGTGFTKMIENGAADGQLKDATATAAPTATPDGTAAPTDSPAAPQEYVRMDVFAAAVGVAVMAMWS